MTENDSDTPIPISTSGKVRYVDKKDIIHFPEGMLGFSEHTEYVIYDITDCKPFKSMLSVKEGGPDFVLVEPLLLFDDYSPLDSFPSLKDMQLGDTVELTVLSIVTLAEKPEDMTVNLRGPILLNLSTRIAKQVVLPDDNYSTKNPLLVKN